MEAGLKLQEDYAIVVAVVVDNYDIAIKFRVKAFRYVVSGSLVCAVLFLICHSCSIMPCTRSRDWILHTSQMICFEQWTSFHSTPTTLSTLPSPYIPTYQKATLSLSLTIPMSPLLRLSLGLFILVLARSEEPLQ
jgi:hypothetical protein